MSDSEFATRLRAQATACGVTVADAHARAFESYYTLLAKWNRRMNLTSLPLDLPPSDETLNRLFLEAAIGAELIPTTSLTAIDLGSGAGSPALPLRILRPAMRLTMVEARERKAAFLREAVRQLGLSGVDVAAERFQSLVGEPEKIDLVTARAVRVDDELLSFLEARLAPAGQFVYFGSDPQADKLSLVAQRRLPGGSIVASYELT